MNIIPYIELKNNKTIGVILTFIEITARIKDLKEQEKLISDHETLLDFISHDINNPLSNLRASIELLKQAYNEDPKHFQSQIILCAGELRGVALISFLIVPWAQSDVRATPLFFKFPLFFYQDFRATPH
ncbi:MAG: hypothetical protein M3Q58_07425 [Bacteroidota bacterium]|nr:hypothetical protein [Bacteroidota bacterium]